MKRIVVLVFAVLRFVTVFAQNNNDVELNYYAPTTFLINKITVTGTSTLTDAILSMSAILASIPAPARRTGWI